jgi:hypothetical protein
MALRVVADTNVYVSIFQFGGRLSQILELAVDRAIDLFVSTPIVMELSGVLAEKFCWSGLELLQPSRPARDRALRPRGGHGQAQPGVGHSSEGGVKGDELLTS